MIRSVEVGSHVSRARRRSWRTRLGFASGALVLLVGLTPGVTAGATTPAAQPLSVASGAQGGFVGVTPFRLLDTRDVGGCVAQASPRRLQVAGVSGSGVPAGVAAVALNVTVVSPWIPGFLTVYPAGVSRPTASSLNYVGGQVIPNNVIVKTGTADSIDIYASGGCPNVVVDVVGYYTSGTADAGGFTGVTPFRIVDTRSTGGCVTQAAPRRIQVGGFAGSGVPSGVAAVALNVTVVAPSLPGFLTVYPAGVGRPTASTLNYVSGQVIPNGTVVKLGSSDSIDVYASGGCPNVIVDVVGYFASGTPALPGAFTGVTPYRLLDSRTDGGCVDQEFPLDVQVAGVAGSNVPAGVAAVALNVTVVSPSLPGYLTVYPAGLAPPTASTLNYVAGDVIPNGAMVKVGFSDSIELYASGGCPDVIVDVVGYYLADNTPAQLTGGGDHTCALMKSGRLKCWGSNFQSQVGYGSGNTWLTPVDVADAAMAVQVDAGDKHTCALIDDGSVVCWGKNVFGQVGDGTTDATLTPTFAYIGGVTQISAGGAHTCALLNDGEVACWGYNGSGELGRSTPSTSSPLPDFVPGLSGVAQVTSGAGFTCALLNGGTVKCWGSNDEGELGNNSTTSSTTPVTVSGISTAVAIDAGEYHTCALLAGGTLKCWGWNSSGQLGNNSLTNSPVPVAVTGITTATDVQAGNSSTCALPADGTVKCWGYNSSGQLGNGTTTASKVPATVTGISTAKQIAVGRGHACALLGDATAKCWGQNFWGQLGDNTTTDASTPVSVVGL